MKKRVLVALVVLALAGCGGEQTAPVATVTVETTVTATTMVTVTEAAGVQSVKPDAPLALGKEVDLSGVSMVVLEVKPIKTGARGGQAVGALVRTCVKADGITLSWSPWSVADAEDGTYPGSGEAYGDDPRPQYPFAGTPVAKGKCAKGWMVFETDGPVRVAEVRYANDAGDTVAWKVA